MTKHIHTVSKKSVFTKEKCSLIKKRSMENDKSLLSPFYLCIYLFCNKNNADGNCSDESEILYCVSNHTAEYHCEQIQTPDHAPLG